MQCRVCSNAVDTHGVFPGGAVRCVSCGADNQVPSGRTPAIADPYRRPETPAPQPPVAHASAALGPLCPRCPRLLRDDPERSGLSCAACGGVFLAHATLATRIDAERPADKPPHPPRHASQAQRESAVHYASCPECRQTMARMNFGGHSGIVVDVCRAHGTWFDGGELEAALDFVRAGGSEEDLATPPLADEATGAEASRLEHRLEATLRAETMAEVGAVEDFIWATGNLTRSLVMGGHGPYYGHRPRIRPR